MRPLPCRIAQLRRLTAGLVAAWASAGAMAAGGYGIESLNTAPTPEFVRDGNSVRVRVTAPSSALVLRAVVKLNGQNVTSALVPDTTPGALVGTLNGLKSGPNVIEVFAGKSVSQAMARVTVSTAKTPQMSCQGLLGLAIPPALLGDPGDVVTITSAVANAGNATLPPHCIVRGAANPYIGPVTGRSFAIGFEVRLPDQWSGRFSFQGGGGNDGNIGSATGNSTGGLATLARGFAVVSTDGGHTGGSAASYGFEPQARIDHAYNAYDKSATIAKALIQLYYGKGPDRSYFQGCSGGGRQGMMFTQRYPHHFDGVIAGAPAMRVATGASISAAWESQTYLAAAPRNASNQPILSQAFSNADLQLVSGAIVQACDALDGLVDGTVANHRACSFDPVVLQCPGSKDASCLSPTQVSALRKGFSGPVNSAGQALYFRWPWDPGISNAGWRSWKLGTSNTATPNSAFVTLIQDATAHEFFTPPDPSYNIFAFNFDTDPARMEAEDQIYGAWRDDQLGAYKARGGKLMIYHGASDPIFSMTESIDYIERVYARHGAAQGADFARLFPVPGMTHCSGGPATDRFDAFAAMMNWVENGNAPDRILATGAAFPGRTRPLCAYPTQAHYLGSGDTNDPAHFVCR